MAFNTLYLSIAVLCCWMAVASVTACTPLTSIPAYQSWLNVPSNDLDLHNQDICTLPAGAFTATPGGITIDLSNNQLQTIPAGLWNPAMTETLTVILSYNSISSVPLNAFWVDSDVIVLRADFNPLSCRDWELTECFCSNSNQVVDRTNIVSCVTPPVPSNSSDYEVIRYKDMSTITALMLGVVVVFLLILISVVIVGVVLYRRSYKGPSTVMPIYGATNAETTPIVRHPLQSYESPKIQFVDSTA